MTVYFVGPGGNNSNNGLTWATRKLTLNGAEDVPVVAGDKVIVGPGTYRETLTVDVSGSLLITGSASVVAFVTQGSPIVIVSGTNLITAGVGFENVFQTPVLANGVDGVTTNVTGTSHVFTSAAGNFQQGHVGYTLRINTIGAFIIRTVSSSTSITVSKPDNSSFGMPGGTGLNYNVGPESPYDVLSVDSSSQITLTSPWGAPSFNGLQFLIHKPIRYVGDYTGQLTDGVGGVVRITGSDNDQSATRANAITGTSKNYRTFQGFSFDTTTNIVVNNAGGTNWIISKCIFAPGQISINISGLTQASCTTQDCVFLMSSPVTVYTITHTSTVDNAAHIIQNCVFVGTSDNSLGSTRVGGVMAKNCVFIGSRNTAIRVLTALTVGQTITVNNCIFQGCNKAVEATATGELVENYNTFFANGTNRTNVLTGANSLTYPALFDPRWFFQMVFAGAGPYNPVQFVSPFDLSSQSQLINLTGTHPSYSDMRGTIIQDSQREWGTLEYDPTLSIKARQGGMIDGGMILS